MMNVDACTHVYLHGGMLKHNRCLFEICIDEADHPGISSMCEPLAMLHRWQYANWPNRTVSYFNGGGGESICMH